MSRRVGRPKPGSAQHDDEGVTRMRDRGQSAPRPNTVGHSRSKMQHEISGCLKRIGSSPFGCVCCVRSNPCGLGDAAALRSVFSPTGLSLISTNGHRGALSPCVFALSSIF